MYIVECADGTLYTGITVDVERRVKEHNTSKLGAKYTKARRPVRLVFSKEFADRASASKEEARIKRLSREEKLTIIRYSGNNSMETSKIVLFKGRKIRKALHKNEWWFSVTDVIEALTDSVNSRDYWFKMKIRVKKEDGFQLSTICRQLKLLALDGKMRTTDCADTEGMFRIIQSIPSPKAEPFKRWLAKVGYERVKEIEDPELATKRTRMLYKLKGYSEDWIEKRMRGIAIREELTDEWQKRGVQEQRDYEILTAELSKATFGVTPIEYKKLKGLKRENLRDYMDDFELIFTMLGERSTTEIHRTENSKGVPKLTSDARRGGKVAGVAKKELEKELGRPVVSKKNFLTKKKPTVKLRRKIV